MPRPLQQPALPHAPRTRPTAQSSSPAAPCVTSAADCIAFADSTPVCTSNGACVTCTSEDESLCTAQGGHCKVADDASLNSCVECTENAHCTNPAKSVCNPDTNQCEGCDADAVDDGSDEECKHIAKANVCLDHACVECTRDRRAACPSTPQGRAVCDGETHKCTDDAPGQTPVCGECRSDLQCNAGQRCVMTVWSPGGIETQAGYFCQWQSGAGSEPRRLPMTMMRDLSQGIARKAALTSLEERLRCARSG